MTIHQLSLFLENKPGTLKEPLKLLGEAGINILTLSLADTQQFGILRLIVREWEQAKALLDAAGCVCNVTEVVAVDVEDRPGGLADALEAIEQAQLDIEYMYAFTSRVGSRALLIFRFADPEAAVTALQARGLDVVGSDEVFAALGN
jgi:hypothetical protein